MNSIEQNWEEIKRNVQSELEISDIAYKTWIEPLKFSSLDGNTVSISFPSDKEDSIKYISKKYKDMFQFVISDFMGEEYEVSFILENVQQEAAQNEEVRETNHTYLSSNLVSKYTFENFVVGSNNNFAYSACVAVAESPGEDFNPLFIYGGSGLGKTHLMHSIGHYILDHNPDMKVLYITATDLMNDIVKSLRISNKDIYAMPNLRDKYRNVDVLLVDDIQFIIGKDSTQAEFFDTFNTLYEAGKAVIISSDKPPMQMETLDERFRSRFQMGLQADIQPPDYETRFAILLKLAEPHRNKISNEILEYIANNIKSNIRELEGAFNKVLAYSRINNNDDEPISMEQAEYVLKDLIYPDKPKVITPTIIIQVVAEHFGVKAEDITSKRRNAEFVLPRQVVMYLCRELTELPLANIAKVLDKKDHSTILHGIKKIEDDMKTNIELASKIDIIKKKINPN